MAPDGSVFIITRVNSVISKTLLIYMFFAIVIILSCNKRCSHPVDLQRVFLPLLTG